MAKSSDRTLPDPYGEGNFGKDPLGELSEIMGISGNDGRDADLSLEMERELFGMNDDAPRSGNGHSAIDSSDTASALESELLAVLGGLGGLGATRSADVAEKGRNGAAEPSDELPDIDLGDLEIDAVDDAAPQVSAKTAASGGSGDEELNALFADVMTPRDERPASEAVEDVFGHDPLTLAEEIPVGEKAVEDYEATADFKSFDDDVELANVLTISTRTATADAGATVIDHDIETDMDFKRASQDEAVAFEAAPPRLIASSNDDCASVPESDEEIGEQAFRLADADERPSADPIADAFADLGDFELPSFLGGPNATGATVAATDTLPDEAEQVPAAGATFGAGYDGDDQAAEREYAVEYTEEQASGDDDGYAVADTGTGFDADPRPAAYDEDLGTMAAEPAGFEAPAESRAYEDELDVLPQSAVDSRASSVDDFEAALEEVFAADAEEYAPLALADEVPDVTTAEVVERIEATVSLDVPDLEIEEEPVVSPGGDFEAEFAENLARYQHDAAPQPVSPARESAIDVDAEFEELFSREFQLPDQLTAGIGLAAASAAARGSRAQSDAILSGVADGDDGSDNELDLPIPIPQPHEIAGSRGSRRGLWVAGALGLVAAAGVAWAVGTSFFGTEDLKQTATVIKADPEPVKIKPEEPGGVAVPNQDKAVYDRVAGDGADQKPQESLVTTAEEPVDLPTSDAAIPGTGPEDGAEIADLAPATGDAAIATANTDGASETPVAKSEERLTPTDDAVAAENPETALITPKRVRTMVVKPDGSLVPREETQVAALTPAAPTAPAESTLTDTAAQAPIEGTFVPDAVVPTPRPETGNSVAGAEPAPVPAAADDSNSAQATGSTAAQADEQAIAAIAAAEPAQAPAATIEPAPAQTPPAATAEPVQAEPAAEVPAVAAKPVRTQIIRQNTVQAPDADAVPVPGERSADQPSTVVGRTGVQDTSSADTAPATEVAALPPAAATGGEAYAVQIASLPTVEEAQKSFANLSSRYGDLIGGRAVNIQKADIPGKGTFFRIRVSAESKDDAARLCSRIKSNGGNCFISR